MPGNTHNCFEHNGPYGRIWRQRLYCHQRRRPRHNDHCTR
nr:MAG TPA: hypothetical protein [Caudoviricetes sp.]